MATAVTMIRRPCIEPGCPALTTRTRCAIHEQYVKRDRERQRQRGSPTQRGMDYQYQRARLRVLNRDGYRCHWCGGQASTADHLVPRAHGGSSDDGNLVAACLTCNSSRGATVRGRG